MSLNQAKNLMRAGTLTLVLIAAFFTALPAQGTGRPKVLVMPPLSELELKMVESFRWDLAEALDKSGKFDIVTQKELTDFRRDMKIGRKNAGYFQGDRLYQGHSEPAGRGRHCGERQI